MSGGFGGLSSLQSQLAGLNDSSGTTNNKNVGSIHPTSNRHEDAIGRGLHHNVQLGHSTSTLFSGSSSSKFKPSILYSDSKAASDVPLATLWENCRDALEELTTETDRLQAYISVTQDELLQKKKGRTTSLTELLYLLSTLISGPQQQQQNCLHVLEYLLRRYNIHIHAADTLLVAFLPHCEALPVVFGRLLQLINVASANHWIWLRPYSSKPPNNGIMTPPPPRQVVAQNAIQNTALLHQILMYTQTVAQWFGSATANNNNNNTIRGIQQILSWSATVLVQGLVHLQKQHHVNNNNNNHQNGTQESVLRILLPFVLNACASPETILLDWMIWGHVMASAVAETMELSPPVKRVLMGKMAVGCKKRVLGIAQDEEDDDRVAIVADALTAIMAVGLTLSEQEELRVWNATMEKWEDCIWLSCSALEELMELDSSNSLLLLPQALGLMYQERNMAVDSLVVCILLMTVLQQEKSSKKKRKQHERLVKDLLQESQLKPVFQNQAKALADWLVATYTSSSSAAAEDDAAVSVLPLYQLILKELRRIQPKECEEGIAYALEQLEYGSASTQQKQVSALLEGVLGSSSNSKKGKSASKKNQQQQQPSSWWMPPRVALEHADASVRLQAIETLANEATSEEAMDVDDDDGNTGERLEDSLLRRMASDDSEQVVLAAAKAVLGILHRNSITSTTTKQHNLNETQTRNALATLYQWSDFSGATSELKEKQNKTQEMQQEIVCVCLEILGQVETQTQLVLEALTAHLDQQLSKSVVEAAAVSVCQILEGGEKRSVAKKGTVKQAKDLMVRHHEFLIGMQTDVTLTTDATGKVEQTETSLRKRSLWVILEAITEVVKGVTSESDDTLSISHDALHGCLYLLLSSTHKSGSNTLVKNDSRKQTLQDCLQVCGKVLAEHAPERLPACLVQLASIPVQQVYDVVGKVAIEEVVKHVKENSTSGKRHAASVFSVLMEASIQETASLMAIQRLLSLAVEYVQDSKHHESVWYCIVPALALLEHSSEKVRLASVDLLTHVCANFPTKKQHSQWKASKEICQEVTKNKASATLGGPTFLSSCLSSAIRSSEDADTLRECLLTLCGCSAVACGKESNVKSFKDALQGKWMPFGQASGNARAAVAVLSAMELAGEAAFPLSVRWEHFGLPVLNQLLDTAVEEDGLPPALSMLVDTVVNMLKGVAVTDSSLFENIVISSGPSSAGRRKRSYSLGKAEGVTFVEPYPELMPAALIDVLSIAGPEQDILAQTLCKAVTKQVIGKESWAQSVFPKLPVTNRRKIASRFLVFLGESSFQMPASMFYNLVLDAPDLIHLLNEHSSDESELATISILSDHIRANASSVYESENVLDLISAMFGLVDKYSSSGTDASDEHEFVRQSFLSAILNLMEKGHPGGKMKVAKTKVSTWVDLLLALNGSESSSDSIRPFASQRAKSLALSLLTILCSHFPEPVVSSLIPAVVSRVKTMETVEDEDNMEGYTRSTFDSIVPVFWKYAPSAGLTLSDLLSAFVASVGSISSEKKKIGLYCSFARSITECSVAKHDNPTTGAVIAAFIAGEVSAAAASGKRFKKQLQKVSDFTLQIIETATGSVQVSSILLLLHYVDSLFLLLEAPTGKPSAGNSATSSSTGAHLPSTDAILSMALSGPSSGGPASKTKSKRQRSNSDTYRQDAIMYLTEALMLATNDALLTEPIRRFIRKSEHNNTELCLRLWQDLLVVQSTASMKAQGAEDDSGFFEATIRMAGASLEHVQFLLPLPIFLASASSLITEGDTEHLRADAIRLVADRAPEVRPNTPEASLFLEMVTLLVGILKNPEQFSSSKGNELMLLQQSALVAIEHIARAHHSASSSDKAASSQTGTTFMSALEGCSGLVVQICGASKNIKVDYKLLEDSDCKLLSSVALCSATLVRVTAPRCLSLLPKFMPQLIACLVSVNERLPSIAESEEAVLSQARMVQVCLLRALASVTDTLPQFVYPFLKQLLAPSALPSEYMRTALFEREQHSMLSVKSAAEALEKSLCMRVPARVLLPVAAKAVTALQKPIEFEVLLRVLKHSIDASSGEELAGHLGSLLRAVTTTYDHECSFSVRTALLESANEAILAMVMKLSEVHLRRLYAILRDWRGSLDATNPEKFALRRHAFWSMSAGLSKELRTIFLPCLGTVFTDAVEELKLAQSHLCAPPAGKKKSQTLHGGTKKRRLSDDNDDDDTMPDVSFDKDCMLSIPPLLLCLEHALRADGQDGGNWIRADDSQKYRSLLEPLGKMLQCRIPEDYVDVDGGSSSSTSAFEQFVQGSHDSSNTTTTLDNSNNGGTVIGCLTALAGAAGNEQLWKPLNYAVLDACGNTGRSEVRRAGLACLLSLMKSLGEEYMVLLPECLPVLSERLEDNDEEVAGLAQDCITLGEELLGESLEDSLR